MSRKKLGVAGAIALIVVIVAVCGFTGRRNSACKQSTGGTTYTVLEGTLESDEVDVSSKIPGRIGTMMVEEGDQVKAGQVLAVLESKEVDAKVSQAAGMYLASKAQQSQASIGMNLQARTVEDQIRQAEAGYKAAKAKLDMAMSGARPQEIEQAKASAEQAQAAYTTAKTAYNRFNGLYQDGVIPKQQEEEIELKYLSAKAQKKAADAKLNLVMEGARKEEIEAARQGVRAAEAQLSMAKDSALQVGLRAQDIVAATYKSSAAKGQLDEAEAYKSETTLIAPISGYVSAKMSDSGEIVSAGYPILTIVKSKDFKVKVYADETKFGKLKLNDTVQVIIPALGDKTFDGRILRISDAADFATHKATNEAGSFDVRSLELVVKVVGDHADLRTGMTARVRLASK